MHETLLARWGRYAARHHWRVVVVWMVVAASLGFTARSVSQGTVNSLTIPGAESQQAVEVLQRSFPERSGDYMDVVFAAAEGVDAPATRARIEEFAAGAKQVSGVVAVSSPFQPGGMVSTEGTVAISRVQFAQAADDVPSTTAAAVERLAEAARDEAVQVELGGPVAAAQEREGPNESTVLGLLAAAIVLYVLFRAAFPAVLPIISSMSGLATGFAVIFAMTAFVDLSKFAPNIAAMLGLGVGIDYALFIVARYREQVRVGHDAEDAVAIAMETTGKSVAFAGGIVITSLLGLGLMGIPFVQWLGVAAAAMVAVTLLAALTLLPALLGVVGARIVRRRRPERASYTSEEAERSIWFRLGHAIMRRPILFFVVSAAILLGLGIPVFQMRLGSADAGNNPESSTTRRAYDLTADGFGVGMNGPLQVVVEGASEAEVRRIRDAIAATPNVQSVSPPLMNQTGETAVLSVVPGSSPQASETTDLVHQLRNTVLPSAGDRGEVRTYVGGATARSIDVAERIAGRLPVFFSLVIGVSLVLLIAVFRSLMIPVKAALMNLLSIGAAYGVVVAVFQRGWGVELVGVTQAGPVESFLPMMLFAVLFGLSMDYEVFLVSRIREEYLESHDNAEAVARGLAATASVITAAALIMIMVFLSFVLNDQRVVKEFGLGLAVAVLVDATVVRLLLVPATMELMGDWNWWLPRSLDRLLPRISIDGPPAARGVPPVGES